MTLKVAEFPKADQQLIEQQVKILEELLVQAKAGELDSILALGMHKNGELIHYWSRLGDMILLSGAIARLQHNIQCHMDGDQHDH